MADLSQHRRTPAELEALPASAAQCGHTFATIESALPGFLARLAERKLKKTYGKSVPVWRPLTRRDDSTYFGRKRRARRARGRARVRRIAARARAQFNRWTDHRMDAVVYGLHAYALRGRPLLFSAGAALTSDRSKWTTLLYDEADSFPTGELTIEQERAAARRTMQRQQGNAYEADQDDC
jgi:hypothetical protein